MNWTESKKNCLILLIYLAAFDEEERILIVSFLLKSLSRVLWTSAAVSIVMPGDFSVWAPFWTG